MSETMLRAPGERRFGRVNWRGLYTLSLREILRFMVIWNQTIAAPLVTAGLFLIVFSLALGAGRAPVMGVDYTLFLAPGILMMTVIQNAFANSSSSLVGAKMQGNIVDTLMPPLSPLEVLLGYLAGAVARGLLVAAVIAAALWPALGMVPAHPVWLLAISVVGSVVMGALGLIAGIWSAKHDQISAITNFVVTPLSFLSGTFYSLERLPEWLQIVSHLNPVFYLIDGARFAYLGRSDSAPGLGMAVGLITAALLCLACWALLRRGYRLKA